MDKVVLEFDHVFWEEEKDWILFISDIPNQFHSVLNLYKYIKKPVLMLFNTGVYAR